MQSMSKEEVESEMLTGSVVTPGGTESNFKQWWKSVPDDHSVNIPSPHEKHGLEGRAWNNPKVEAKHAFLDFVDANSQPVEGELIHETQLISSCWNHYSYT